MHIRVRNTLPVLIAASWLALSWYFVLGAPRADAIPSALFGLRGRYPDMAVLGWFVAMIAMMILVDRAWCAAARRHFGDPRRRHWSRLRNRDGMFFCAECRSIFLVLPVDRANDGLVQCGDCGHAIATYGEMRPHLRLEGQDEFGQMARRLLRPPS